MVQRKAGGENTLSAEKTDRSRKLLTPKPALGSALLTMPTKHTFGEINCEQKYNDLLDILSVFLHEGTSTVARIDINVTSMQREDAGMPFGAFRAQLEPMRNNLDDLKTLFHGMHQYFRDDFGVHNSENECDVSKVLFLLVRMDLAFIKSIRSLFQIDLLWKRIPFYAATSQHILLEVTRTIFLLMKMHLEQGVQSEKHIVQIDIVPTNNSIDILFILPDVQYEQNGNFLVFDKRHSYPLFSISALVQQVKKTLPKGGNFGIAQEGQSVILRLSIPPIS